MAQAAALRQQLAAAEAELRAKQAEEAERSGALEEARCGWGAARWGLLLGGAQQCCWGPAAAVAS